MSEELFRSALVEQGWASSWDWSDIWRELEPAVDAARAEGEKQGAARVREAVEAVLGYGTSWIPVDATSDERALCGELIDQLWTALTEAAPQ